MHLRDLLARFFQNNMEMVHNVIQSVLQNRRDRGAEVSNAGKATVEVAARDDSKIDDSRQVSSVNVFAVVIPTHPLDCRDQQ